MAIAAAFAVAFGVMVALPASTRLTNGFSAYYTAGRLLRAGADAARFYDDDWFQAQTLALGFANARDIFNFSPPAASLLLWPLAELSPVAAKAVWTGLNLLFVALALVVMVRLAGGGIATAGFAVVLATLYQPLREEIRIGQAYALLLVLEAGLAWAYLRNRDAWTGLGLGFMLALKTAGLALPALLIAQRRWLALAWTLATAVAVIVATLPIVGPEAWITYGVVLTRFGAHPELAVTAYQSLAGFALHLFRPDPTWNPAPVLVFPVGSVILLVVGSVALVVVTFVATWRVDGRAFSARSAAFAAWAILSVVLSPAAADYHYTLLLVPIALLVAGWRESGRSWRVGVVIALGVLLVGAPLPYQSPRLAAGGWALFAYPKLYGGLILWGVALAAINLSGQRTWRGRSRE